MMDALGVMDAWDENKQPPDRIVARRPLHGGTLRTRPLCSYPQVTRYRGPRQHGRRAQLRVQSASGALTAKPVDGQTRSSRHSRGRRDGLPSQRQDRSRDQKLRQALTAVAERDHCPAGARRRARMAHDRSGQAGDASHVVCPAPSCDADTKRRRTGDLGPMSLGRGTRLGHYEVVSPLGKGGMGEVYLAEDVRLGRRVALKVLPAASADDQDSLARFIREARAASALNHPNIITIHDIGDASGPHFIAYEFVDGRTLGEVARSAPIDATTAIDIGIQVASALAEAHRAGIVHRDLKPDNVMIRATGLVKLLDFGIARLARPAQSDITSATAMPGQTVAGMLIGTPQYMSPEQARGLDVDDQTDLFSFGALLHELLSGRTPFAADTVTDIIVAVLTREPPPLPGVPPALCDIVSRALKKDRAERYATAAELLLDLTSARQMLATRRSGAGRARTRRNGDAARDGWINGHTARHDVARGAAVREHEC